MSHEMLSILGLAAMFVVATILPVNMGILAFAGAFLVGTTLAGLTTAKILSFFPSGLFLTLVGITYLFAIAQNNGTIDWLVRLAVRAVRGHVIAIPWVMFLVAAALTSVGAVSPGAVAIIAPIALGFAVKYGISPLLMGLMVIHGAQAGGFSPISIYGGITNGVVAKAGLPLDPIVTFLASFAVNGGVAVLLFFALGGMKLIGQQVHMAGAPAGAGYPAATPPRYGDAETEAITLERRIAEGGVASNDPMANNRFYQLSTLAGLILLAVLTLVYKLDIGFCAISIGLVLSLMAPTLQRKAVAQVTWPEIVLITGVSTYVGVMEAMGTISYAANSVAGLASPLMAALVLCLIGAVVSAFASSTAVLGSLIPLAVPFLHAGTGVDAIGFIAAMAVSSTIVDVSPFSTNGALVLANSPEASRDGFFKQLLGYGALVTVIAPFVVWFLFVVL
ncbi:SLC13 family permease [Ancylobacter sp. SL191]|uniref:SLC13 family permease n=1 Tax=Ancylobacter sp. SL191 TaxID=2995166 RepID=UPI002271524F|nr:SLC13 family permease [Ancylobacter sp. SL191]WAC28519.1 SLC13 family permease [Ancylobacter sp. SL191]